MSDGPDQPETTPGGQPVPPPPAPGSHHAPPPPGQTGASGTTGPGASQPAPPVQPAAGSTTAGLGIRFGAKLLDGLIVGIPLAIILGLLGIGNTYIATLVQTVVALGYFVYLESTTGATIGKRLLNLKVVDSNGGVPSQEAAFKRNIYYLLQLIPTLIGGLLSLGAAIGIAVTIANDEHNRGFHDTFAGTGVMRG